MPGGTSSVAPTYCAQIGSSRRRGRQSTASSMLPGGRSRRARSSPRAPCARCRARRPRAGGRGRSTSNGIWLRLTSRCRPDAVGSRRGRTRCRASARAARRPRARCRRSASHAPPVWMPIIAVSGGDRAASAASRRAPRRALRLRQLHLRSRNRLCRMSCAATGSTSLGRPARAGAHRAGDRGVALVHERHRQAEAAARGAARSPRPAASSRAARPAARRQADHEPRRLPLAHQRSMARRRSSPWPESSMAPGWARCASSVPRPRRRYARRNRSQTVPGASAIRHAPLASCSRAKSTPRSSIAAAARSSAGVSKMIASRASTVSQAFCLISCSSWPAPSPRSRAYMRAAPRRGPRLEDVLRGGEADVCRPPAASTSSCRPARAARSRGRSAPGRRSRPARGAPRAQRSGSSRSNSAAASCRSGGSRPGRAPPGRCARR